MIYGTYLLPDGTWQSPAEFEDLVTAKETLEYHAAGRMVVLDVDPERLMVRAQMELAARREMLLHEWAADRPGLRLFDGPLRRTSETFRDRPLR